MLTSAGGDPMVPLTKGNAFSTLAEQLDYGYNDSG